MATEQAMESIFERLGDFLAQLRSTSHRIAGHWHEHDVWIAEVEAEYVLQDWLRLDGVPRAFVVRAHAAGVAMVHVYGAHEARLSEHGSEERGFVFGGNWVPPL